MKPLLSLGAILVFILSTAAVQPRELHLLRVYPIDSDYLLEPSGIYQFRKELFVVSDNNDSTIFRLEIDGKSARMVPFVSFRAETPEGLSKLDFEGITCDANGDFYLISESAYRILKVTRNGRAEWIGPNLQKAGASAGLFTVRNGGVEGIILTGPGRFLLCAERQARGIMEVDLHKPGGIRAWNCDQADITSGDGQRLPDFSDLSYWKGRIFAIARGAEAIVELQLKKNSFRQSAIWSMRKTLTSPQYRYRDRTFGLAEGLYVGTREILVVVDNNGDSRESVPDDSRPLLFVFKRP